MLGNFFANKKAQKNLIRDLEIQQLIMEREHAEYMKTRAEEESILNKIAKKRTDFTENYAPLYKFKLNQLSNSELKSQAIECVDRSVKYVRALGALIDKEEVKVYSRVLGVMLHDLMDSVHNLPRAIAAPQMNREEIEYEIMLVLQFIHSYDDFVEIQKDMLCIPFIQLRYAFPEPFLIEEEKLSNTVS